MGRELFVILATAVLFLAMIVNLAGNQARVKKLTGYLTLFTAVFGIFIYGWGLSVTCSNPALAVLRSLLSVCYMFLTRNDYAAVSSVPFFTTSAGQILFWLVHFSAVYCTSSAVMSKIGTGALRRLRLIFHRKKNVNIIYGIHEDSIALGHQLCSKGDSMVIYMGSCEESQITRISSDGGIVFSTNKNCHPTKRQVRMMGCGGCQCVTLYALNRDETDNLRFSEAFMESLRQANVRYENTRLVIPGYEGVVSERFQASRDHYGFGNVLVYEEPMVTARSLIQKYCPCNTIRFSDDCRATEDFKAVIVGMGQTGQAILQYLVMNGQFEGSRFSIDAFATDCQAVTGGVFNRCPELCDLYQVTFHSDNAKSHAFYEYLEEVCSKIKYLVLCTGKENENAELYRELSRFLERRGAEIPVFCCTKSTILHKLPHGSGEEKWSLYESDSLTSQRLDKMAMAYHQCYCQGNGEMWDNWRRCDCLSRDSNRAAADYTPAILRAAQVENADVNEKARNLSPIQRENLARSEHLRWCAFLHMNGYSAMPEQVFNERCERYRAGEEIRVDKDDEHRYHVCLVPWDELDQWEERVYRCTGKAPKYKTNDLCILNTVAIALEEVQK